MLVNPSWFFPITNLTFFTFDLIDQKIIIILNGFKVTSNYPPPNVQEKVKALNPAQEKHLNKIKCLKKTSIIQAASGRRQIKAMTETWRHQSVPVQYSKKPGGSRREQPRQYWNKEYLRQQNTNLCYEYSTNDSCH